MTSITSEERFDDVAPENSDGTVDYAYRGFNYVITIDERVFQVRTYDDEPGIATVIGPTDARTQPEARALVQFITSTLNCTGIQFYCGPIGTYRPVEIQTLEFT
jgi:hypothetical protein